MANSVLFIFLLKSYVIQVLQCISYILLLILTHWRTNLLWVTRPAGPSSIEPGSTRDSGAGTCSSAQRHCQISPWEKFIFTIRLGYYDISYAFAYHTLYCVKYMHVIQLWCLVYCFCFNCNNSGVKQVSTATLRCQIKDTVGILWTNSYCHYHGRTVIVLYMRETIW